MTGYQSKKAMAQDKLTQPAQEPVTWVGVDFDINTDPPQRPWVDLTRTQIQDVYFAVLETHRGGHQMQGQLSFGEALQAAIKDKNK